MTHSTNIARSRPLLAGALIASALASAATAAPAEAQETIRIAVAGDLAEAEVLAATRRRIAEAARAHCDRGGLAALYRSGQQRCRDRIVAEGERQIRERAAPRLAAR